MKLIGLCGEIGSGKDAFADYLVREKGFNKIVMSDLIKNELEKLGRSQTRKDMQEISQEYKKRYGQGVWAKATIEYAKQEGYRRVIVSGVRDTKEVERFKKELNGDFILVYVTADSEKRYNRVLGRKSKKDPRTIEDLVEQDKRDREIYDLYNHFEELCDERITNNNTLVELFANADLILKKYDFEKPDY